MDSGDRRLRIIHAPTPNSGRPTALPGTRAEANAVGDVVLVGQRATEATLGSVVRERERWRAVHVACHGLVNPERPQLSSLALTADTQNDGFLTVLEVFRMKIPADLVVLSACETAKGKVYKAEGIIGFTRAFMMVGAPRVIVSLWKVDDAATKALMVTRSGSTRTTGRLGSCGGWATTRALS